MKAYLAMVEDPEKYTGRYISIGPVTTKTAEKMNIPVAKTARVYTAAGMVEAMIEDAGKDRGQGNGDTE